MNADTIWKIVSSIVSILIVPLFIWIWNTNIRIEQISAEFKHTVEDVDKLEKKTNKIEDETNDMDTKLQLVQQKLDRVETMTEELLDMAKESKNRGQ